MTAISADRDARRKDGDIVAYDVQASEIIYKGVPVVLDASDRMLQQNDGTTLTLASGDIFVGISYEGCDNSAGADEAKKCRVWRKGVFLLPFSDTLADTHVGSPVYINNVTDDSVVTVTSDTGQQEIRIGTIVEVEDTGHAWVQIDNHVDGVSAVAS